MIFSKETVEKYQFRFCSEDVINVEGQEIRLNGGHAVFLLDTRNYTLSIESDWGEYCYRWYPSQTETFKDLMLRVGGMYLQQKFSDRTEIDWKKTVRKATEYFFKYGKCKSAEKRKEFLNEIKNVDHNEIRFYDFVCSYAPDLWEGYFFVKDYPIKVKVIVLIFELYLKSELKKEKGSNSLFSSSGVQA